MEPQPGWGPAAVTRFLCSGRDWEAVRSYCRNVVTGDATIGSLGLQLLAAPPPMPPPPPAATGASSTAGLAASAAQPAEHSDQQPSDGGKGGQQSETEERPLASAAAQRRRLPFARTTFLVCLSYYGPAFSGWQYVKEEDGQSVQEVVQLALQRLFDARRAAAAEEAAAAAAAQAAAAAEAAVAEQAAEAAEQANGSGSSSSSTTVHQRAPKPKRNSHTVYLAVAGRTDRGVHALQQVVSFPIWDYGATLEDILAAINDARPGVLRAWHAEPAPRSFHATFAAHWRRYMYLLPLRMPGAAAGSAGMPAVGRAGRVQGAAGAAEQQQQQLGFDAAAVDAAPDVDPARVAALLARLEGRDVDYGAFSRGTPPGKDTRCCLLRARAWAAHLPDPQRIPVLAIELLGNRFLRRMVRVLVATAVREAVPQAAWFGCPSAGEAAAAAGAAAAGEAATAAGDLQRLGLDHPQPEAAGAGEQEAPWDAGALLRAAAAQDRALTAPAAPAEGLCFLEAGYTPLP